MTDHPQSGVPAETPSAPPGAGEASTPGSFGATRGSGLARGKRATTPAASAAPAGQSQYKPTTVEVLASPSEYKNPFASEPVAAEPSAEVSAAPAPVQVPSTTADSRPAFVVPTVRPAAVTPPAPEVFPFEPPAVRKSEVTAERNIQKPSLNILPPAETKRASQSWESAPSPRPSAPVYPRQPREDRRDNPRPAFRQESQRPRESDRTHSRPQETPKSGGFFGWLKGLFAGKKPEPISRSEGRPEDEHSRDGQHRRRRRRGGRGRHNGERSGEHGQGPSQSQSQGPSGGQHQGQGGEHRGGDNARRRQRGGRGRNRNDHGDRGGPRSEGQQGGGFI